MDKTKAATLARTLMNKHGLSHVPFSFDRAKTRAGVTKFTRSLLSDWQVTAIQLSGPWTEAMSEDEVRDTILHEIAHAIAGHEAGHDWHWRQMARSIGARPERCGNPSPEARAQVRANAPWVGVCPNGHTTAMHRAPQRVRSCGKCSSWFKPENILAWTHKGAPVGVEALPVKFKSEYQRVLNHYQNVRSI